MRHDRKYHTLFSAWLTISVLVVIGCKPEKKPTADLPRNDSLRFSAQPIPIRPEFSVASLPLDNFENTTRSFKKSLQLLAQFGNAIRSGETEPAMPDIFAQQFETTFLERNKLQSAFLGGRIRVARWRPSKKTPTYYETIAVSRLFATLTEPWKNTSNFRIEFQIHTVRDRPNYYDTEVLVSIAGNVDSQAVRPDGGQQEIGRSATSLWQIIWLKDDGGNAPKIKKINMVGHEETVNYVDGGTLFKDCTGSVLRNDESLQEKLSIGLDDWAKQIPGLDIIGNNGVAVGDVNNDGMDDIYVCQPHGIENLLLVQNPDGTADNIAAAAGVDFSDDCISALLIDIDNDRFQDLVVATSTRLVLLSNTGNGTFQLEHKLKIGVGTETLSAVDFDNDGDLDLFLTKFRPVARFDDLFPQPNSKMNAINGGRNVLLRNDEAWEFTDVTSEVGLDSSNQHYTRSANWTDFDADGDLDLYLVNEYHQDMLFEFENGWFSQSPKTELTTTASNSTTASSGDFDHDGKLDVFVAADAGFAGKRMAGDYINSGGKHLRDAKGFSGTNRIYYNNDSSNLEVYSFQAPIFSSQSTFSSVVADFNNDSWEDIALTNGWLSRNIQGKAESIYYRNLFDPKRDLEVGPKNKFLVHHEISDLCRAGVSFNGHQRNCCFLSLGALRFSNYSCASGFDFLEDSRGIASTDWDGDGDIDLVVTNRTAPRLRILQNVYSSKNQYLKLRLVGTNSNRDAIGSRVEVHLHGKKTPLVKSLSANSGRISQSSKEMHFGLGKGTSIEKVIVNWPGGTSQTFEHVSPNRTWRFVEDQGEAAEIPNDRFRIALDSKPIFAASRNEKPFGDIRFFPTTRLPILQYRIAGDSKEQKWYQIENIDKRPLFCIFCPRNSDNSELLLDWKTRDRNISQVNADLLIAFTGNYSDTDSEVKFAARQIKESGLNFRWGVLSESSNKKLKMAFGQWFYDLALPDGPFGILLDGDGNIHFAYREDQLTWDVVSVELRNVADKNYVLDQIPERSSENWVDKKRTARFDRLKTRFDEIGYVQDAKSFAPLLSAQHAEDYLNRAIDLASKGSTASAINAATRSNELNPDSVESLIGFADISRQFALTADQQARTRMLRESGELLDRALELEPTNVEAILARAEIFRLQKDVENAIGLLKRFLKIDPECWQVHAIIGRLFFHKKEHFEATKYLIKAIENRPTLPYVAADLGLLYLLNNQYSDAKEFLELAIRLQPSNANPKRHLAESEFWNGNFESAGVLFEETVKSQPTLSHPKQMLAWLKGASPFASFRDGEAGLSIIEPFIDLKGDQSPISLEIKAVCLAEIGEFDQALIVQKKALASIENNRTLERYSQEQLKALKDRLELYKRGRTYRIKDVTEVPLKPLGQNAP